MLSDACVVARGFQPLLELSPPDRVASFPNCLRLACVGRMLLADRRQQLWAFLRVHEALAILLIPPSFALGLHLPP